MGTPLACSGSRQRDDGDDQSNAQGGDRAAAPPYRALAHSAGPKRAATGLADLPIAATRNRPVVAGTASRRRSQEATVRCFAMSTATTDKVDVGQSRPAARDLAPWSLNPTGERPGSQCHRGSSRTLEQGQDCCPEGALQAEHDVGADLRPGGLARASL